MTHLTEQEARERYDFARVQLSQRIVGAGFTDRPVEEFESAGERAYAVLREAILREDPHRQALEEVARRAMSDLADATGWIDAPFKVARYEKTIEAIAELLEPPLEGGP